MQSKVNSKLMAIVGSEVYRYSREEGMRRILPSFVENENLRVEFDRVKIMKEF